MPDGAIRMTDTPRPYDEAETMARLAREEREARAAFEAATKPMITDAAERMRAYADACGERSAIGQALELVHSLAIEELVPPDRTRVYASLVHARDFAMIVFEWGAGVKAYNAASAVTAELERIRTEEDHEGRTGYVRPLLRAIDASVRAEWSAIARAAIEGLWDHGCSADEAEKIAAKRIADFFEVPKSESAEGDQAPDAL